MTRKLPSAEIEADTSEFEKAIERCRQQVEGVYRHRRFPLLAAALVGTFALAMFVLMFFAGRASAQPVCTVWVNQVEGSSTVYAPGDYESFVLTLEDGSTVEAGPVVLGQQVDAAQPILGATKCTSVPDPTPTPEPTPDKTPDPVPTPPPLEHPVYVTACGLAEVVAIGDGWSFNGTPIVKGHVLNDGDTIVHESGATFTFVAPTEDYCTEVVVPTPTPDVVIPPPPIDRPVCMEDMPCWDCETMGNGECGPPNVPATPVPAGDPCAPPPVDRYTEPTCLPETGRGLDLAFAGVALVGLGVCAWAMRSWLDRRAVDAYRKAGS